jgi:hypothetical protein
MAPARTWEEYLFTKHAALAVSPWKGRRGLQLLDVLIKRDTGLQLPGRPPVIHKIGTFFNLREVGDDGDDLELEEVFDRLKKAVLKYSTTRDSADEISDDEEEPVIERENLCNIKETVKASSKTLASIQPAFLSLQHDSSKELIVRVEDVTLLSIDRDSLQEAILQANWKPNMETIAQHGATPSKLSGLLDLWLVTDILYAEKFTTEAKTSSLSGARVQAPGSLLSAVVGVPTPSIGFNVQNGQSRDTETELTGGIYIPFGIRALRLRYKANGTLYRIDAGSGKTQPVVRAGSSNPKLVDPVSDPTYNMGDLFLNNVPVNPEDDSCIPLDILTDNAAESAQQCD